MNLWYLRNYRERSGLGQRNFLVRERVSSVECLLVDNLRRCRIGYTQFLPHSTPTYIDVRVPLRCRCGRCRILSDTLDACTYLLLLLSPTPRESSVCLPFFAYMPGALPRCPVTGCGAWKHSLNRGGSNRRWYSVDSNRHLLIGLLDETLAALPCNDRICPNCYKRIRRFPPLTHNLLDELTAAADEHSPTPPPPPSPPSSLSPPPRHHSNPYFLHYQHHHHLHHVHHCRQLHSIASRSPVPHQPLASYSPATRQRLLPTWPY